MACSSGTDLVAKMEPAVKLRDLGSSVDIASRTGMGMQSVSGPENRAYLDIIESFWLRSGHGWKKCFLKAGCSDNRELLNGRCIYYNEDGLLIVIGDPVVC